MPLFVEIPFQKLCEIDTLAEWHLQILFSFCVHQHTIDMFSRASPSRPVFLALEIGHTISRADRWLHVTPRIPEVTNLFF